MKRIVSSALLALGIATAATLPYQGLATDAKGNPQADASYQVDFALYPSATSVTPLWSESQKLSTRKGLFSTLLGNETPIPDSLFKGTPLYLGVSFGGGSEGGRALLGMTPWAKRALVSDTAKVSLGLSDSVTSLRSALAGQASTISSLSATVTAQGTQITTKDSVRASHMADSAKVAVGLKDSVIAVRSALRDTAVELRTKTKADSQALAKSVTDSTKALRDTVTNLKATIAGLNTTVSGQTATIVGLSNSVDVLQALLLTSNNGIAWNTAVNYGYVKDSRDGQVYRTVAIGNQTWMAQNLNFAKSSGSSSADTGICYNNSIDSCAKFGRLYTWAEAMKGAASSATSPSGVKGICPTGWHVPSDVEWQSLEVTLGMSGATAATSGWRGTTEGTKLKSTIGWTNNTGIDMYGFRVLPGGCGYTAGSFISGGSHAFFWSSTENDAQNAKFRYLHAVLETLRRDDYDKTNWFSVRCLKD